MRWDDAPEDRGRVKFAAAAETVEGYGGRGLNVGWPRSTTRCRA